MSGVMPSYVRMRTRWRPRTIGKIDKEPYFASASNSSDGSQVFGEPKLHGIWYLVKAEINPILLSVDPFSDGFTLDGADPKTSSAVRERLKAPAHKVPDFGAFMFL